MSHTLSCTWVEGLCLWRPLSFRFLLDPVSLERPKPLLTRDSLDCVVGTKASPRLMHFFSWAANIELSNCTIHHAFIRLDYSMFWLRITAISPWSTPFPSSSCSTQCASTVGDNGCNAVTEMRSGRSDHIPRTWTCLSQYKPWLF